MLNRKKLLFSFLFILLVFLIFSYFQKLGETVFSDKFVNHTGVREYKIWINAEEDMVFDYSFNLKKGNIKSNLYDFNNNPITDFELKKGKTSLDINETGFYKIVIETVNATGDYRIICKKS